MYNNRFNLTVLLHSNIKNLLLLKHLNPLLRNPTAAGKTFPANIAPTEASSALATNVLRERTPPSAPG